MSASVLPGMYPDVVLDQAVIDNNLPHVLVGYRGPDVVIARVALVDSIVQTVHRGPEVSTPPGRQGEILRCASPFSFLALKCAVTSVHSGKRFSRMVLGKMDTDDHID